MPPLDEKLIHDVVQLDREGMKWRAIARALKISRNTVSHIVREHGRARQSPHSALPTRRSYRRPSKLDSFRPQIDELLRIYPDITAQRVFESLRDKGFPVLDLTDNELAKLHTRHMVGGHAAGVSDEMVLRFEFPERPGALFNFLNKLGGRWNISMFHYRNHGAAYGRVVAGLQVPASERHLLPAALDGIGYQYWDETDNPAYRLYLG